MKKILISALAISFLAACKKEDSSPSNAAPTVTLAESNNLRLSATVGDYAYYYALATDTDGDSTLSKVVFYANDVAYDTVLASTLKYARTNASAVPVNTNTGLYFYGSSYKSTKSGDVVFKAKAYDNKGGVGTSNTITVTYSEPAAAEEATPVKAVVVK